MVFHSLGAKTATILLQTLRKKYPQEINKYYEACRQIGKGLSCQNQSMTF
jgi:hypothetical protein